MKKVILTFILIMGLGMMIPNTFSAQTSETNPKVAVDNINSVQQLHQVFVNEGLVNKNDEGKLVISTEAKYYDVNSNLFVEYKKSIRSLNFGIEKEIINLNSDLSPVLLSKEQVINNMRKEENQSKGKERFIGKNSIPKGPSLRPINPYPRAVVSSLVTRNRNELEGVYDSALAASQWGGGNPYSVAVGYFVGKVMPYGDWDYKRKSGYSPWYKTFNCYLFGYVKEDHNSKWIGNYNYGFVGEFLFSKNALMTGSAVEARGKPDYKGQKAAGRGYDDAIRYY